MDDFADILSHPRYTLRRHRPMRLQDRAAQFSAFAALTGYDEDIGEAARLTDARAPLAEDDLAALDAAFGRLLEQAFAHPAVTVSYFQPDARKSGGAYCRFTGAFRHYDAEEDCLIFTDGTRIPRDLITAIYL